MFNHRYSQLSIALHWLMFFLLVAVYACIELRELYPKGSDTRELLKTWHFMLGLSMLILVLFRILARFLTPPPPINPPIPNWQRQIAIVTHFLLHAFMLLMPIAGWMILSGEGKNIPFYGMSLPSLIEENESLSKFIEEIHETAGTVGYYLIGLHVIAGLFHHLIRGDNTLIRIMPRFVINLFTNQHYDEK